MTLLSNAVRIANKVTLGLRMQAQDGQQVTLKTFTGDGGVGAPVYSSKKRDAVVEKKLRQVRSFSGILTTSSVTVTFLDPTVAVKPNDQIILADGTGGEVIGAGGPVDASGQLLTEAYIG